MFESYRFYCVCLCYAVSSITIQAFSIQEFNALVEFPMWKSLKGHSFSDQLSFGDDKLNGQHQEFNLKTLFPDESSTSIINEGNLIDRAWQFHLLLSVNYAIELVPLLDLILEVWKYCNCSFSSNTTISHNELFQLTLILNMEIKRMQKSLLYFSDMLKSLFDEARTSQLSLANEIYDVLEIVEKLTFNGSLTVPGNSQVYSKYVPAYRSVRTFFVNHVQPVSAQIILGDEAIIHKFVGSVFQTRNRQQDKTKTIAEQFKTFIWQLIQSNNGFGLQLDLKNGTVSVKSSTEDRLMQLLGGLSL